MKRRDMLATTCGATAVPLLAAAGRAESDAGRELYELRHYRVGDEAKRAALADFLAKAAVPAWNRAGVEPVGLFEEVEGKKQTVFVLLPHKSFDSVLGLQARLAADKAYLEAGKTVLLAPKKDPAYERVESWLLQAFAHMPKLQVATKKGTRIFELRTYESHSAERGLKKIEMFNEGGEIDVFRRASLQAVFFAQTLFGTKLPNLTYMLAFDDMTDHDAGWKRFRNHPDWKALRSDPQYKDTVSKITKTFLRPLSGSQI